MLVVSLPLTITSSLIQEKLSLFGFLYQAHHPVQLLHQSLCLVVNFSRWWTEPPIRVISCVRISLTQMIFLRVQTDMCRRANCLLSTFSATNPAVKTLLFRTFCLSLYGSSLWSLASPGLHTLEVTFNNILRKIWKLPRNCHTSILHCVSRLQSLHNVVIQRSKMLCLKARATGLPLIRDIFTEAPILSYTSFGFNILEISKRTYNDEAIACANFIRDVQLFPQVNRTLLQEINYISTC